MIYRLARDRDKDGSDFKGGTVIKDGNGKVVTERSEVLEMWKDYFQSLLNQSRVDDRILELPTSVRKNIEMVWN